MTSPPPSARPDAAGTQPREAMRSELASDIVDAALLRGDFVLSSGVRSDYYLDKYLFETKPDLLRRIAPLLAELLPPGIHRIAGPELGAVALATAVSLETGLPFAIVRKDTKDYGTARDVEGEMNAGDHVAVVEDVVTSGAQAIRAAEKLRDAGVVVEAIVAVIDREQGGPERIEAAGFRFDAVFRRRDLGV